MTTLADMTPEERSHCRGMWCDTAFGLGILEATEEHPEAGDAFGRFQHPAHGTWHTEAFTTVTPRPDLPRAWNPDGTPPAGEWEDDYTDAEGSTLTTGEDLGIGPHQEIRRWIGDWEQA